MVLACDLVVASRRARFALPEVKRGLLALYGGVFRGARALPLNLAREMVLTGEPIDAERAHALGLVNRLCDDGAALDRRAGAGRSPSAPTARWRCAKACASSTSRSTTRDALAWQLSAEAAANVRASEDSREGIAAFLEKRAPRLARPLNRRFGLRRGYGAAQGYFRCCRFAADPMIRALQRPSTAVQAPTQRMETSR